MTLNRPMIVAEKRSLTKLQSKEMRKGSSRTDPITLGYVGLSSE